MCMYMTILSDEEQKVFVCVLCMHVCMSWYMYICVCIWEFHVMRREKVFVCVLCMRVCMYMYT
jgi:hypothetical protein